MGIAIANAGTTGLGRSHSRGFALCTFDNSANIGDYVQISGTTDGNCHSAGAAYPSSGQVLGRVWDTTFPPTYGVGLFGVETRAGSGGTIAGITTAAGSGLIGGVTSGTLNLSLPTTCGPN